MGTRKSKHNKGRKPRYKDFAATKARKLKRNSGELSLEQQANVLLYGHANVIEPGDEREVFTVIGAQAPKRTLTLWSMPKPSFYSKKSDQPICSVCGRPCAYGGAQPHRCRECFRANAMDKFIERSPQIEHYLDLLSNLGAERAFEGDGIEVMQGGRLFWTQYEWETPDFAPELIKALSEMEEALDLPAAKWKNHPELFAPHDRKPLFFAHDGYDKMVAPRADVYVRISPKSKAMRGKLLKAA